jgi:type I restriction enzyme R subunit
MPHAYTEDQLVEQPAIGLFAELGWAVAGPSPDAGVAGEPRDAGLLGRETKGEVVLVSRLRAALERLNPALPPEAIAATVPESCLSGWLASVATRGFPASSYLSRKRPV